MYHILLTVLLSLVGTGWSLPQVLDEAMIHGASADMDLSAFYKALKNKDYRIMPDLYEKLEKDRQILKTDSHTMQNAEIPETAKPLKRLLQILLDQELFKIQGLMPDQSEGPLTNNTTKKPKPSTEKPTITTTKKHRIHKGEEHLYNPERSYYAPKY